jgi:uncharacterized lipoprotein YajG
LVVTAVKLLAACKAESQTLEALPIRPLSSSARVLTLHPIHFIDEDTEKWSKVIRAANIKAN